MNSSPSVSNNSEWAQAIGESILLAGSDEFYNSICSAFTLIPGVRHPILFYFPVNAPPRALYFSFEENDEYVRKVEMYVKGPYVLDPYYLASIDGIKPGAYRLDEVAPDNFKKSEYFRSYYKAIDLRDEIAYVLNLPNGAHIHVSLVPIKTMGRFPIQTINFLKAESPIINALILKHWNLTSAEHPDDSAQSLHLTFQRALQNFGSSILTQREQAVLQLVLQGHSNKSAAVKLEIALATVKLHRAHIYRKLDIRSQSELFHLFIDCISQSTLATDEDPLRSYMDVSA